MLNTVAIKVNTPIVKNVAATLAALLERLNVSISSLDFIGWAIIPSAINPTTNINSDIIDNNVPILIGPSDPPLILNLAIFKIYSYFFKQ